MTTAKKKADTDPEIVLPKEKDDKAWDLGEESKMENELSALFGGMIKKFVEDKCKDEVGPLDPGHFYLVVIEPGKPPFTYVCDSLEQVKETVSKRLGTRAHALIFQGHQWHITKGPFRYLVSPDLKSKVPLFVDPDTLDLDPQGNLFDEEETEDKKIYEAESAEVESGVREEESENG